MPSLKSTGANTKRETAFTAGRLPFTLVVSYVIISVSWMAFSWVYPSPGHWPQLRDGLLMALNLALLVGIIRHFSSAMHSEAFRRHTETFYRQIVETAQEGIWVWDAQGMLAYVNHRIAEMLGYQPQEMLGKPVIDFIDPLMREAVKEHMTHRREGETETYEIRLLRKDGGILWAKIAANPLMDEHQHFIGGLTMITDITEQHLATHRLEEVNRELTVLADTDQALIRAREESALLERVCRIIVDEGGYALAWVGFVEDDTGVHIRPVAHAGADDTYLHQLRTTFSETAQGYYPLLQAIQTRAPAIVDEDPTNPSILPWRDTVPSTGYMSIISLPLREDSRVFGVLTIASTKPDEFDANEVDLLEELANDLAFGISAIRTRRARIQVEIELRTIFDTVPAMILYKDRQGKIVRANRAARHLLGLSAQQLVGKTVLDLFPAEEARLLAADDDEVMLTGQPKYNVIEAVSTPSGIRWLETDKIVYRDHSGSIIGVLSFSVDITERKRAEEAFEREHALLSTAIDVLPLPIMFIDPNGAIFRANRASHKLMKDPEHQMIWDLSMLAPDTKAPLPIDQRPARHALDGMVIQAREEIVVLPDGRKMPVLVHAASIRIGETSTAAVIAFQDITPLKEADQAKNHFLAMLTHELRTPLTNILGWVREARESPELVTEALKVIERNAKQQHDMLEDLLDISRMLHGKLALKLQPADLWQLAEQSTRRYEQSAAEHGLTLTLCPPDGPLPVLADVKRIRHAFADLLNNAIRFTNPGGEITISGHRGEESVSVSIQDTGRGISSEQLPLLFEPFRQIDRLENVGGMGLGLVVVKGIVDAHGGRVIAASAGPGQGSTFTIELPIYKG
ncbi:MAG: PAS domain S-box protein [Armatimonadota bacterium]